jgi:hypothetical protein
MRPLLAWFRARPLTTVLLGLLLCLVAGHFYANWRADVRWRKYEAEARARGVKILLPEFALPEIPDAQNFAALPMFRAIFEPEARSPLALPMANNPVKQPDFGNAVKGVSIDWASWQKLFHDSGWIGETTDSPERDVLRALEHYAPHFAEWHEWRNRPQCRFPLELDNGMAMRLPHLQLLKDATKVFALQARAQLALGEPEEAYQSLQDVLQTQRALKDEPTLVSGLTRLAAIGHTVETIGEGLRGHHWDESTLRKLQTVLATISIWEDLRLTLAAEYAGRNSIYELLLSNSAKRDQLLDAKVGRFAYLYRSIPRHFFRANQLRSDLYFDELLARISVDGRTYDPDLPTPSSAEILNGYIAPYYYGLFRVELPMYASVLEGYVRQKAQLDEASVAIALELYRLAHGGLPETLRELVPEYLPAVPLDPYTQKPLLYRRAEGGTFLLYSVGKNRTDDGGVTDQKLRARQQLDDVWLFAPLAK